MGTEGTSTTSCDKPFSTDHLLLSPKDVGLFDLIKLLFFKNIGDRKFVDCPDGTEESFSLRFLIFISVVVQKILPLVYKPLKWVGLAMEFIPNFKYVNGGTFYKVLVNIVSGKLLVLPDKDSPEYLTAIGLWDIRRDLIFKLEDPRYKSALAVMASKVAYENEACIKETVEIYWEMEFLGFFDCWNDYEEEYTTQGFMWSDKKEDSELIGVCFRGTSPFDAKDWSTDIDLSWYELPGIGKAHGGFLKALGLQKCEGWPKEIILNSKKPYAYYAIRQKLKERLDKNPNAKFLVTGHSLGAALSILFAAMLSYHKETELLSKLEGVYTFGQPRVGDRKFGEYMKEVLLNDTLRYHRFVYCNDLVPRVPFDSPGVHYKHFGNCLYFNSFYKGQMLPEEPNKNYFSFMAFIPMFVNAFWELLRSFIMFYQNGPEYCETNTCRGWRVIGLLVAGLSAHGPTDYVNLTRLGKPELFTTSTLNQANNNDS